uniref:60S ribosome subunit biogenesis protein NIP7 pre-PUA domain-containing protein n=1 Tax=Rhinopithecus roxellana TaxID=61622 RepID=A0A2K6QDN1_RHIRO
MRPLTEEETRVMFEKIARYIGENLQLLVDQPDGIYCFHLHNDQVYYVSEKIMKLAANISGDKLVSLGSCFGKVTKTHKFWLHVTALDYLAPYAKYKQIQTPLLPSISYTALSESFSFNKVHFLLFKKTRNLKK